jgi:hypothetical protein
MELLGKIEELGNFVIGAIAKLHTSPVCPEITQLPDCTITQLFFRVRPVYGTDAPVDNL